MCKTETTREPMTLEAIKAIQEAEYEATRPAIDAAYEAAGGGDTLFHRLLRDPGAMSKAACALQDHILSLAGEDPDRRALAHGVIYAMEEHDMINIRAAWLEGRKVGAETTARMLLGRDLVPDAATADR